MYAAKRELKSVNSNEKLEKLINALTSKNEAALVKAGSELKAYVEAESRELSDEKLASFQDQIMIKIHELFHTDARLGGIVGVSYLVDLEYMDNTKMVTRLASYIHKCLPCDSVQQVRLAARLMGRLAVIGGNVTHDFAEAEIRRSLEWLSLPKDYDNKRYASVLMLKELVENAPQLAYPRVESILNNIWNPLRDPNQHIWEAAAQALSSVLDLIGTREYEHRRKWYKYLFQMSMRGIENRLTESGLHASLLALQEQVNHHGRRARRTKERADGTRAAAARVGPPQIAEERQDDFMLEHFQLVGQKVLSLMDHRSPLIRLKVTEMLPCLARFHPEAFCHFYLSESIGFLLGSISAAATAPVERAAALLALGGLAEVTGRAFAQAEKPPKETAPSPPPAPEKLILTVLATLKGLLVPRRAGPRDRPARDDGQAETLACFAKIVKSCAEEEVVSLCANETLTQICSLGLSPELCQVLTDITNTLPYTLKRVQKHLLQQATAILAPPAVVPLDRSRRAGAVEVEAADPEDKLIALEVAGTFNFQGNLTLMAFVRQTAVTYLTDPSPLLRKAAARACCHLVAQALDSAPHLKTRPRTPTTTAPPPPLSPAQAPSAPGQSPSSNLKPSDRQFMPRLLCNLLAVAVSDVDPEIRMVVLGALEARFDPFLCSPECLRLLFMCLNDEVLPNRHAAIDILGRVNRRNPAYIHTSFRVVLLQLINALEYTQDARKEEESALLLSKVIRAAPALIPPYAARILEVLVKKLGDATVPAVTGTLLSTLGELSIVCGASLSDTPRLLPLVIEILMDQSSWVKRIHALRALGNIVVSTGNVISPYTSYPQLLPFLLKALMPDQKVDWESRREIMKLVGIVGAIDPYRHKQIQLQYHEETEQKSKDSQKSRPFGLKGGVIPFSRLTALMEEYYPTVVINCLLSILSDESLAEHHQFAMAGFLPIFRALGIPKCLPYLPPVLPRLLKIAETDNLVLREYSLGQITGLLNYVKQHAIGFMEDLFRLVQNFAHTPEESTLIPTLSLVEEMRVAFHEDFPQFLPWLIPWLVRLVKENYADTRKLSIKVFHCFEVLGEMCEHYLNFVIPCLVETLADSQIGETVAAYQCRTAACNTLCNLSRMLDTRPYVCRIIHPLFRTLVETASAAGPATPAIGIGSVASAAAANAAVGLHHVKDGLEHVMQPPGFHPPGPTAVSGPVATAMNQLHEGATSLLCHVVHGMGPSALRYCKMLQVAVKTHRLNSLVIDILISKVLNGELLDPDTVLELARPHAAVPHSPLTIKIPPVLPVSFALSSGLSNLEEASEGPPPVNATNLTAIYEFSRVTEEDWIAWNNQLALELIRQSPSTAIRHCFQLAALYLPLARELFNAAFVSCYNNLKDGDQVQLLTAVSQALDCRNVPISVLQTLLNFTEFLEHQVTLTGNGAAIFARARQRAADPEMDPDPVSRLLKKLKSLPVHPHATGGDLPAGLPSVAGVAAEDIFDIGVLARNALNCHLYAKALRYKEIQFLKLVEGHRRVHSPQPPQAAQIDPALVKATEDPHVWLQICQELIDCNHRLDLPESSIGKIRFCQNNLQPLGIASVDQFLAGAGDVLEKLNRWDESLKVYERRLEQDPKSIDNLLGVMRSLRAMGEWGRLIQVCEDKWRSADDYTRQLLAPMAGHAAWILSKWNFLAKTNEYMDQAADPIACFLSAVLSVHQGEFQKASTLVHQCRKLLAPSLAAYVSESYDRAYYSVVQLQQLSEVEEVISFKKALELADQARAEDGGLQKKATDLEERREQLRSVWGLRLKGMQLHVQYWEEVLAVQSLALTPHENMNSWLKFSNLARQAGKPKLAQTTLINLLTPELIQSFQTGAFKPSVLLTAKDALPQVVCAYFEHMWGVGEKTEAMALMAEYVTKLHLTGPPGLNALKAQGYLTLGKWQQQLQKDCCSNEGRRKLILQNLQLATQLDPQSYKAWHAWALFNQKIAERLQKKKAHPALLLQFLVCAIRGFVQSIYLCSADISMSVQDLLRLLTIWFNNGTLEEVAAEVNAGITKISVEAWLLVIPQIIARLQSPIPSVSEGVSLLLTRIGQAHPQALIYPVTVAAKDTGAGVAILESMKEHSPSLVAQASLVSDELIRIAILWLDQWCEGIEQANKAYFVGNGSTSADGMMAVLEPLHSMMQNPETETEKEFLHQFGADLMEAHNWCKQYRSSRKQTDMNKAWDLYYHVFRRLNKFIAMTTLQLASVAPRLMSCRDLDLAIPGQYRAGETPPCIRSFAPTLQVIQSKQRPRKLTIHGSDGNEYSFLLKGHEDLRQDQRVMQLFGLVNNFFLYDLETARRDLSIEKYPVVPLSSNVGIIGWLEHAETFHNLLVEYRKAKKIHLTLEHKLMTQMTADYDNLALMQKVEVFEYALENTDGQDLNRVLWLKSPSSQVWLDRRTCYTRSLATMSMVGYILGLGDRHPSNITLDRLTNKVVHIDFGDCFEVAQHREKYPERVPFRLTRMLVNAMEASGIDGTFYTTCERVMKVLRKNKDSLMAMLEAFVHDPLIAWRLAGAVGSAGDHTVANTTTAVVKPTPLTDYDFVFAGDATDLVATSELYSRTTRERMLYSASLMQSAENTNKKALEVVTRIKRKLEGTEFAPHIHLPGKRHSQPAAAPAHTQQRPTGAPEKEKEKEREAPPAPPRPPSPPGPGAEAATSSGGGAGRAAKAKAKGRPRPRSAGPAGDEPRSPSSISSKSSDPKSPASRSSSASSRSSGPFSSSAASTTTLEVASWDEQADGKASSPGSPGAADANGEQGSPVTKAASAASPSAKATAQPPGQDHEGDGAARPNGPSSVPTGKAIAAAAGVAGSVAAEGGERRDEAAEGGEAHAADRPLEGGVSVAEQIQRLIEQATSHQNLCQCYIGWCPFW